MSRSGSAPPSPMTRRSSSSDSTCAIVRTVTVDRGSYTEIRSASQLELGLPCARGSSSRSARSPASPEVPVPLIETAGLTKVFRQAVKDPGLGGSFKHLVTRQYKDRVAVSGVDLAIEAGEAIAY